MRKDRQIKKPRNKKSEINKDIQMHLITTHTYAMHKSSFHGRHLFMTFSISMEHLLFSWTINKFIKAQ